MAESVEKRLEQFTPAFEQLISIGAFTKKEIKMIIKKRRAFEYSLSSKLVTVENFLNYIKYEAAVLELTDQRKEKCGIDGNQRLISDIEWPKHIHTIYRRANSTFPDNIQLWNLYFDYCKGTFSLKALSTAFNQCIKFHAHNPDLWIKASLWEMKENNNPEMAREYMQQAILLNPKISKLYSTYAETIIYFTQMIEKRREIQNIETNSNYLKAPLTIFENGLNSCEDKGELLNLFLKLFNDYSLDKTELIEKSIETKDPSILSIISINDNNPILKFNFFLDNYPNNELEIKFAHYLCDNNYLNELYLLLKKIKISNEIDLIKFLNSLIKSINNNFKDLETFLPNELNNIEFQLIKLQLINLNSLNIEDFINNSKDFLKKFNSKEINSNFLLLIGKRNPNKDFWINIIKERSYFIDSLTASKVLQFTLYKFNSLISKELFEYLFDIILPTTEFLKSGIEIYKSLELIDIEKIRSLFEIGCTKYGDNDYLIWLDYCKFEFENRNWKKLELIRHKASKTLKDSSEFIRIYQKEFCK